MRSRDRFEMSLHEAARLNRPDMVLALLEAGADIERSDEEGRTPLCLAALYGSKETLKALIGAGADVNARIEHSTFVGAQRQQTGFLRQVAGTTALHLAAEAGRRYATPNAPDHLGCAQLLLAYGSDVGAEELTKETRIIAGVKCDEPHLVSSFVPLNYAGTLEMAKLLVAHRSPRSTSDSPIVSAVRMLEGCRGLDIAAFLFKEGYELTEGACAVMKWLGIPPGMLIHRAYEMRAGERHKRLERQLRQASPGSRMRL
ncbi:MAG: hypothetical protein DI562_05330 [Stenotrophomonas acidaminiphila]|nr:MAG: hypothetical protein DI562_05330 [Stenotrophomonas acidaminiphila]